MKITSSLRPAAYELDESDIVAVANHGRLLPDLIPLWVGEGDMPTPQFIVDAANKSLAEGETFYTWQRGIPELRETLATYHAHHYSIQGNAERFFVTGSGMQAIQIALQALAGAGDEVLTPTPCWPNIHAATQVTGAKPVHVELDFSENGWSLDLQKLFEAVTPDTKVLFINSPSNPTGWVASKDQLAEILQFARRQGIWIIADEVYSRFYAGGDRAPSFYDVAEPDDRIVFVNTFSKNWAMTGWRAGWISAPPEIGQVLENLIQYSTSGVPVFTQRAAIAAVQQGEALLQMQKLRALKNRDLLCDALLSTQKVELARPDGAFYLFFKIKGQDNSKQLAINLIDEAGVGLAPGSGFYTGGEKFLRLCYLRDPDEISKAADRLTNWLKKL